MNREPWNVRAVVLSVLWTLALIAAPVIKGQQLTVSGTVSDPTGDVLIGVTVSVKGDQKHGTSTDIDGNYSLTNINPDATLVYSYVGFGAVEEKVNGRTTIDVTLREDAELLNEVVVVGYGSLSRKEVSSSIVQVNRDDFAQGAMNNPMEMLTGKVAGTSNNLSHISFTVII